MSTFNVESAERSGTHTLHDSTAVAKAGSPLKYPFGIMVSVSGNYTYRLSKDTADTTTYFAAGVLYPLRPILIKATGAPAGATTCTVFYRQ